MHGAGSVNIKISRFIIFNTENIRTFSILEIELSNFRPEDFRLFHNSLGLPMF